MFLEGQPPASPARAQYGHQLTPEREQQLVERLAAARGCSTEDAATLFCLYRTAGLPGLIDWRCGVAGGISLLHQRIRAALDATCAALLPRAREHVEQLLGLLVRAIEDTQAPFSVVPLLSSHPSSAHRRRRGRAVWFGAGAIQRRRQRARRKPQRAPAGRRQQVARQADDTGTVAWPDAMAARFAALAGIAESDARMRIRDVITAGPIGILPRGERLLAVDSRYVEYLELLKYGHLDGTISRARLHDLVNRYGREQHVPPLSPQVLLALSSSIARPRRWFGGEGVDVGGVAQRAAPVLQRPQLHASWLIVVVRLDLPLAGSTHDHAFVTVVVEEATQRPMGCWVSPMEPGPGEIGLALYDAIWHPAKPIWPRPNPDEPGPPRHPLVWGIRGIPETIRVPARWLGPAATDVDRAASYLATTIARITNKVGEKGDLAQALRRDGPDAVRATTDSTRPTAQQAYEALLLLLHRTSFRHHTPAPLPARLAKLGVEMPGHRTPAAGWLLPVTGEVQTTRKGVIARGQLYTNPWFYADPGQRLHQRAFPYFFPNLEQGCFVRLGGEDTPVLEYVLPSDDVVDEAGLST